MNQPAKRLHAVFFRTDTGREPVREWLKSLTKRERTLVGTDLRTVELGWPIGMPTCRPLGHGLFEVRTHLPERTARVLFMVDKARIILLHGFIKKTQKTPNADLELARRRQRQWEADHD